MESKAIAGAKYIGREAVQGINAVGSKVIAPIKVVTKIVKQNVSKKIEKIVPKKTVAEIRKARAKVT